MPKVGDVIGVELQVDGGIVRIILQGLHMRHMRLPNQRGTHCSRIAEALASDNVLLAAAHSGETLRTLQLLTEESETLMNCQVKENLTKAN